MSKKSSFLFSFPEPGADGSNVASCGLRIATHMVLGVLTGGVWLVFIVMMALASDNEKRRRK